MPQARAVISNPASRICSANRRQSASEVCAVSSPCGFKVGSKASNPAAWAARAASASGVPDAKCHALMPFFIEYQNNHGGTEVTENTTKNIVASTRLKTWATHPVFFLLPVLCFSVVKDLN